MSDDDTLPPETDYESRARLRAFADEVSQRTDTEAALERMLRRSRPPTARLMAIAACLLAVVALAAALATDRASVDTIGPSESPTQTTDCLTTTVPRAITKGAHMNKRFAAPVASTATAIMLLVGCNDDDDGPTTLARGDVEFVGDQSLGGQRMVINAQEQDGKVTGEVRFTPAETAVTFECADTSTDGIVIVAGEVTTPSADGDEPVGLLTAVIIREGDPDGAIVWFDDRPPDSAGSCAELIESIPDDHRTADSTVFVDVEAGEDIETG